MGKQKSVKFNFIMNAVLTMSSFVFPLISFPYISRILLADGTGKVSFATSLISYFTVFSQLGVPTYGIRKCATIRDDKELLSKTVQEIFILRFITTAISYIAFIIALLCVPRLREECNLYIVMSFNIFFTFIGVEWLYKALEQYVYITIRSLIFKLIALAGMFLLIHEKEDYVIYGALTIFAGSASNIFNFINLHRYIDLKPKGNYDIKQHIKPVMIFFAMSCATTIYTHLDTVMLGFMTSDTDVGYYSAAVKIKTILVSIITSLGAVLLPRSSYYIRNSHLDEFKRITVKALKFVIIFASPLMIFFMCFAKYGIRLLAGNGYDGAIIPMIVIMPTLLFIGMSNITGMQILVPTGREKIVLYSEIIGAIVDVIINLLLIPSIYSVGAAVGTLIAEFVVLFFQCMALKEEAKQALKIIPYIKILVALVLAFLASMWVILLNLNSFFTLFIAGGLFFGVYILVLLLEKEELTIEICNQIIGKFLKKARK